jgi:hypothetical protein
MDTLYLVKYLVESDVKLLKKQETRDDYVEGYLSALEYVITSIREIEGFIPNKK